MFRSGPMPTSRFGPLATAFEKGELTVPGYLELLHFQGPGVDVVLDRIRSALSTPEPQVWVNALFDDPNWRPHLVGAAALLLDETEALKSSAIWHAIDGGSWVTPQLVVTAYFVDPAFPEQTMRRLESRCAIEAPAGLSPPARHSATGPAGTPARSAKLLASLTCMGIRVPRLVTDVERISEDHDMKSLRERDIDRSADIVTSWYDSVLAVLSARKRTLMPRFR